ncbi:hypothetical protein LTR24_004816 [Lithohypha guttulata]|uniref:Uncharacterized protein n=1 Tax=Lithohypha guttulata TaxID=1690604 RepID=A0ABR0KAJ7_9EURO|nr:hypothetical protein LTR24_004816 [Lithohypha guttulata]
MERGPQPPRARPVHRPPPPSSPVGRARPTKQSAPASAQKAIEAEKAAAELQEGKVIRRRQYVVWAVGAFVFTVACTFVGARLKEFKQESDRMKEIEAAARKLSSGSAIEDKQSSQAVSEVGPRPEQNNAQAVGTTTLTERARISPYSVDVARQIALLEDRRAILNRQKLTLEAKILMLKERQARKAQMDARRPTPDNG